MIELPEGSVVVNRIEIVEYLDANGDRGVEYRFNRTSDADDSRMALKDLVWLLEETKMDAFEVAR
ncbi:hypothetical protein ACIP5Y_21620 [Nocardia sp. NPDC088792]|uniref:hypothetical protein n=1 Tax=Nocardia sp. NPDC088792 TaxID=3364332 RepID=UPI003814D9AC